MPKKATRGTGVLENYLSKKRAQIANKLISKKLKAGRILDIGCGKRPYFLLNTKFGEKFGIDACALNKKYFGITIKSLNVEKENLPFKKNFFDVITMLAVIEHFEPKNLRLVLKETYRALKVGGRLILTTPCTHSDRLLRLMAKVNLVSKEEIDEHKCTYIHKMIIKELNSAGYKNEKIKCGYFELYLNSWAYAEK